MKRIAHRGYRTSNIKENTMEAFTNAKNHGFAGIEFDVRKTKDEILVICHDASIDRTSDGHGFVKDKNLKELTSYNFGSKDVPSKIPELKEVLTRYKNTIKLIELKTRIDISQIENLLDQNTYFISFDTSYMYAIKKGHPNIKCGVLNYVLNSKENYDLDLICILDAVATDDIVMHFLNKGIKVFIYGIVGKINYVRDYENLYYIVDGLN